MFKGKGTPLSASGLAQAAQTLGVELPALWAVMSVETRGCGFLADRRPLILFERHWFRRLTGGKFDATAPDLSNALAGGYGASGAHQYERLERAIALDRKAALESTSWGLGQVMGFNARNVKFADVEAMVQAMCDSEDAQFQGMVGFVQNNGLAKYLRSGDWSRFAKFYNGPDFQKNQYDIRLARAHARHKVGPLPDLRVRAAQMYLSFLGYNTGGVDGWFGERSHRAVIKFQSSKGIAPTGALDDETFMALENAAAA